MVTGIIILLLLFAVSPRFAAVVAAVAVAVVGLHSQLGYW